MLDFLKGPVETFQEFLLLSGRAFRNIVRSPHYADDILLQMDAIGVGSLFIVSLIGFFSGVVMALQMSRALTRCWLALPGASSQALFAPSCSRRNAKWLRLQRILFGAKRFWPSW